MKHAEDPSEPNPPPEITAFRADEQGLRIRQFTVGAIRVRTETLVWLGTDDEAAAEFTACLAAFCVNPPEEPRGS